ncbi:MAG: ATP-binding protein [Acidobacteriota bacterium]|nr:ATP-binding protein [Acidobacteriota bacterium]
MQRPLAITLALSAATAAAIIAFPLLTLRASLAILLALVTGVALALIFFKNKASKPFPLLADLQDVELTDAEGVSMSELFAATMGQMREAVVVIDYEMRVVASNPAARSVFTYAEGVPDAQRLTELTRNPSIYAAFLDGLQGKERAGVKVEGYGQDRRVFDLRVVPLRLGERREAYGAIGIFFDITQLERLEGVRQEFLSNVSHELRTPLTAILAFVETLEDGAIDDPDNNRRFLSIIRKNAARMHTLIDDILELSAIEAGNVSVRPTIVPLREIAADVMTGLRTKADARAVLLRNEVGDEVRVFADERRLEQMLTNLVDNAIKFNREGGTVVVSHEREKAGDLIRVADTGDGIPPDHLSRLFERFYRVDRARSRDLGGTGLGLAIVKHLALAHSGEIAVSSRLGEGSKFTIKLPAHDGTESSRPAKVDKEAGQN